MWVAVRTGQRRSTNQVCRTLIDVAVGQWLRELLGQPNVKNYDGSWIKIRLLGGSPDRVGKLICVLRLGKRP